MTYDGRTISFQVFMGDSVYFDILGLKLKKDNQVASDIKHYLNSQAINELGLTEESINFYNVDEWPQIAGIVEDFKIGNILTEQHPVRIVETKPFEIFVPWNVLIKVTGDKQQALQHVWKVFENIYSKDVAEYVFEKPFMTQQIEEDFKKQEQLSTILTIFAIIAIMISMLGLMAMSTYYVRQRATDIAVHKVMGGTSSEVLSNLVKPFMLYVFIAALISIPIIYFVMNDWLSQFSYRITIEWWVYAFAAILAMIICFASVVFQCYKAANTNPINSLK